MPLNETPLPRSRLVVALEVLSLLGILCSCSIIAAYWQRLPRIIPSHFDFEGRVDGFADKEALLILPAVSVGLYILLTVLSRFHRLLRFSWPFNATTEEAYRRQARIARSLYCWCKFEIVWLFTYISWATIRVGLGKAQGLGRAFLPVVLIVVGGTIMVHLVWAYRHRA
jgi:uncharacterized membrane protein